MPPPVRLLEQRGGSWEVAEDRADLRLPGAGGTVHHLVFTPESSRLSIGLHLAMRSRAVDVTNEPGLLQRLTDEMVSVHGGGRDLQGAVATAVADFAQERATWSTESGPAALGPVGVAGAVGHPLLQSIYERGGRPIRRVPRWATPILTAGTAREGAQAAFGVSATRPVVSAIANSLCPVPDGAWTLRPIALGLMGWPALGDDRLAALISAAREAVIDETAPDDAWSALSAGAVSATRDAAVTWGPEVAASVLGEVAGADEGIESLGDLVRMWRDVGHRLRRRLPRRLAEFRRALATLMPLDPGEFRAEPAVEAAAVPVEQEVAAGPAGRQAAGRVVDRPVPEIPVAPLIAPRARPGAGDGRFVYPGDLAALDRQVLPDLLSLTLPRSAIELRAWAVQLENCLDGYADAVARGRSWVIGVNEDEVLAYAVEITPQRRVRQFVGLRNRPPRTAHARIVTLALLDAGVLVDEADAAPTPEPPAQG